eukprot:gene8596-11615_t
MASTDIDLNMILAEATTEDKNIGLAMWWERHCKPFSEWFISMDRSRQEAFILKACPDMSAQSNHTKKTLGDILKATDIIIPEMSLESLLNSDGRILILFVARRCVSQDLCFTEDVKMLNDLYDNGSLPNFNEALKSMNCPFIDPVDHEENIRSLAPDASQENKIAILNHFKEGRLIRAEVWLSLKLRRTAICNFIISLVEDHEVNAEVKPIPTFSALLRSELEQQKLQFYNTES